MIDQRINDTLKELEQALINIDSARSQVEKTVNSFDGLNSSTSEYVSQLGALTTKVKGLIEAIETDYNQKTATFEKDRKSIIESANSASKKLADATETFANSLDKIDTKLKYSMLVNAILSAILGLIIFLTVR